MPETPDFDRKLAEHKLKALEVELWPIDRPQPYERKSIFKGEILLSLSLQVLLTNT